jgi:chlorophyll synthase
MTLNDFKSIEGDRRMGIGSLPVQLGPCKAPPAPPAGTMALAAGGGGAAAAGLGPPGMPLGVAALLAVQAC